MLLNAKKATMLPIDCSMIVPFY